MEQTERKVLQINSNIRVSVLVAVYNAEKYLCRCLDSLLAQTLENIQIICIDDCSTDASLTILRGYAAKDARINVLHLEHNRGQAHARNQGLQIATGEYIAFLDSDDWMDSDTLEKAVEVFDGNEATDCVLLTPVYVYEDGRPEHAYPMESFQSMPGKEAFEKSINWDIHGVYVARRWLYEKYPFDETCRTYSDDNTTRLHYINSREVSCCEGVYHYFQHSDSVTHTASISRLDYMRANESMKRQLVALNTSDDILNRYETVRWLVVIDCYLFYCKNKKKWSKEDIQFVLYEIRRVRSTIEWHRLPHSLRCKFGYMPILFSWKAFRLQLDLYYVLRKLFGRD